MGRKQPLCTFFWGRLKSHAFHDHLSTLSVALRHPIGVLATCLASSKSLTFGIYSTWRKRDVTMEIEMICPDFFLLKPVMPLVTLL